jgi:acyl-coenzyme A synthetase/AMP-(fatty) acid ligase/acyl carrier protein
MQHNDIKTIFLNQTIDGRFLEIAKLFPDNIAYIDDENTATYKQLSNQVEIIASIIQKNLSNEDIIGLYFEQSLAFIICFLGVIRSGKVAVPLEINSPENRLLKLFSNAKIKTIIKSGKLSFFDANINVISYSDLYQKESGVLSVSDNINNETVILYTSGSTGEPKGVIHTHKSFMHCTYRFTKLLGLSPTDKCTFLYSTAHMGGTKDIFNTLLNGATLHYYSIEKKGYHYLPTWIQENKITVYTSIVTVFRKLCSEIKDDLKNTDLRVVRLGGELSLKSDFDKYKDYFPDNCLFISGLASSETGLIRQNILTKNSVVTDSYIANGYPVEDVDIDIRDEQGITLEDGMIGTIVITSDYISTGYKNMPELTLDRYRINNISGKREYWSGDTGYIKDGNLVVSGRSDLQIKISGRRIDLSEIDSVVMDLSGVTNSAALYYEETKSIILFVETSKIIPLTKEELHKYLSANLPFYMQPTRLIILSALPLTASYKVNKKELYTIIKNYERPYVEATGAFETEVVNVWRNVLNKEKIGIHDNFFELGGDSITATSATVMLEKIFNIKIPYGYFYQAQTVYYLAQAIQLNNFNKSSKWLSLINEGTGVPIYWLLNGENTLRKYLPDDQEIYRINTHYDQDMPDRKLTVEGICNEFVKEILQINRGDRCIVGGFSMGARFAYEVAQQLKKSGINIDLLILLDPSERKAEKIFDLGDTYQRIKSLYHIYTNSLPADKREHIFQYYKYLKNKHLLSNYDGKVLLMQRTLNVAFEDRDWPKITDETNLIFYTLEIDDHLEVVNDKTIQLHWINKIKEHIYDGILNLPLVFLDPLAF